MKGLKSKYFIIIGFMCIISLLLVNSYSWIKRLWTPSIEESEIGIQATGSLGLQLDRNAAIESNITLNDIADLHAFSFKQVSNVSGNSDDFFKLQFGENPGDEIVLWLDVNNYNANYTVMGVENGYIEFSFILFSKNTGNNYNKYVFLNSNTSIEPITDNPNVAIAVKSAMRVSITLDDRIAETIILKNYAETIHTAITNDLTDGQRNANGNLLYADYDTRTVRSDLLETNNNTYLFSDYFGGVGDSLEENFEFDESKTLFSMANLQQTKVTIRLWLEGNDVNCTDNIGGIKFKFSLIFDSRDIINE